MGSCTSVAPDDKRTNSDTKLSKPDYLQPIPECFSPQNACQNISELLQVGAEIGRGATAYVFTGFYHKKEYAIKRIKRSDEFGSTSFMTEARTLSSLSHPGIITYIDILMDDTYYYLVLDKADYDLYQVLTEKCYLSESETKHVIYSVLSALSYIHRLNIVHRDLKPENIVFKRCSEVFKVQIIDFGDAAMITDDKIYTEFVGTPCYMSPERLCEHNGEQLKKSDVWAIGVIAYEIYSGCRCFESNAQKIIFGRILRGQWSWNTHRKPSILMQDLISKCLNTNPEERLSANDALKHQWFADITETEETSVASPMTIFSLLC